MHLAPVRSLFILLLLAPALSPAQLLVWDHVRQDADEGTWEGCGPGMSVHFTDQLNGPLQYLFEPDIDGGDHQLLNTLWSVFDGDFNQWFGDTLSHTFPVPGEHLVCLTANALDLNMQPCSTTTCRLVEILQDASCAYLEADFTISNVSGQSITFEDLSFFPGGIYQQSWSYGNEGYGFGPTTSHTFSGPGPHKVCLTVTGPPPVGCVAQACKWLYLGPVPVSCEQLFMPGFLLLQTMDMVGVLDTSSTSGMHHEVIWDFGDGSALDSGRFAIHAYSEAGQFELCSTVRFWGPLVADTCASTHCKPVAVFVASTPDELAGPPAIGAHPVPFEDLLWVTGMASGPAHLQVFDAGGRLVHEERANGGGPHPMDLRHLRPGVYMIRCLQQGAERHVRVLRQP